MEKDFNSLVIRGKIVDEPQIYFYDGVNKTVNYKINVEAVSKNNKSVIVPVVLPSDINIDEYKIGRGIFVKGTLASHRIYNEVLDKNVLHHVVMARVLDFLDVEIKPLNNVILTGYLVSKERIFKNKTGEDYIRFIVASNRDDKSNYIRCSCRFERAHVIDEMKLGSEIEVHGPIIKMEKNPEFTVLANWLKGYDKSYVNKDGYIFGYEEDIISLTK